MAYNSKLVSFLALFFLFFLGFLEATTSTLKRSKDTYDDRGLEKGTGPLPDPHIILLGPTGVGKSSLANGLIGMSPDCENCTFEICVGSDSCTKETSYAAERYVGEGQLFTVVDTPGFGDSDNDDNELIDEMTGVLKNTIKTANALVLLFNGQQPRFDENIQQMIREMEALFAKDDFWSHTILGVSRWSFTAAEQARRNFTGETEEWWTADMNSQLREKFHLEFDLPAVFIDSHSQMPWNLVDPLQQVAFTRETGKLWDLSQNLDIFEFKSIEDVLNELTECKTVLETNITELWRAIEATEQSTVENSIDIIGLTIGQGQNTDGIALNSRNIALNTNDISQNTNNISQNSNDIFKLNYVVDANQLSVLRFINESAPPVGAIVPWTEKPIKAALVLSIVPDGWQLCDGAEIRSGPWQGYFTPDLNNQELFLRGSAGRDRVLDVEGDTFEDHTHVDGGHTHTDAGHSHVMDAHSHNFADSEGVYVRKATGNNRVDNEKNGGWDASFYNWTNDATSTMKSANADIQSSSANIGGAATGRKGAETRPKNMRIQYIIRIY